MRLFSEKGFRGTTTRELAAAVGVTEPVLYQHFSTKRELYHAIIEHVTAEKLARAAELEAYSDSEDDRGFLSLLGELLLSSYEEQPHYLRLLLFSALEGHELADLVFERYVRQLFDVLAGYIRRRIKSGAFRAASATTAARGFVGMITYHGQLGILFPDRVSKINRRKVVDQMVNTFLNGIVAAGTPARVLTGANGP
jgi:AcrR family transcriptional regulator